MLPESYTAGTDTEDGVCDACADGTYSAGGTMYLTATSCAPGQSYTPATNIEDGRCDACADGTYSAGGTETTCTPHEVTSCAPGQSYTPATNIEDGR